MSAFGSPVPSTKSYRLGTHRAIAPEDTFARLRPLIRTFGISRVANLTGLDRTGIPVVMVCRPNSRSSAVFHGKGLDIAAAKTSGVMEAIETWHAENHSLPLRYGSYRELCGSLNLVDVDGLARVPGGRFTLDLRLLWVEGRELQSGIAIWVPLEIVHADCTMTDLPGGRCFSASTNGLASGNNILEATCHALCEVIERDATSLWHALHPVLQDRHRLSLASIDDSLCRQLLDRFEASELDVGAWDTTTDVGVPSFDCVIRDRTGEIGHVGRGAGCHPARHIALLRALTEAIQVRVGYIAGSREDIRRVDYDVRHLGNWDQRARSFMSAATQGRDFSNIGSHDFGTFEDELAWLLKRLAAAGIRQAIAIDLTKPEIGLPVVRTIVPGLEGSNSLADYAPGARALANQASRP